MESISSRPKITLKDKANIISTTQFPKRLASDLVQTYQKLRLLVTKDNYKKDFCIKIKNRIRYYYFHFKTAL
jgi:hypothetical protein